MDPCRGWGVVSSSVMLRRWRFGGAVAIACAAPGLIDCTSTTVGKDPGSDAAVGDDGSTGAEGDGAAGSASGGSPGSGANSGTGGGAGDGGGAGAGGTSGGTGGGSVDGGGNADAGEPVEGGISADAGPPPVPEHRLVLGAVVLFDGTCPAGWTELVDMQNRYVRGHDGDTDRAETGGDASHTHDIGGHDHTALEGGSEHTHAVTLQDSAQAGHDKDSLNRSLAHKDHRHPGTLSGPGGGPHEHAISAATPLTTTSADNLPAYREVVFCRLELADAEVPRQGMVLSPSLCAEGYTEVMDARDRLLRGHDGDDTYGELGGSDEHTHGFDHDHGGTTELGGAHTHGGNTAAPGSTSQLAEAGNGGSGASASHTHTLSLTSDSHQHSIAGEAVTVSASAVPRYHEVSVCKTEEPALIASGALILFDDVVCPDGFVERPEFQDRFLRGHDGDDIPGERSGSDVHDHDTSHSHGDMTDTVTHNHGGAIQTGLSDVIATDVCCDGTPPGHTTAAGGHRHTGSIAQGGGHAHPISEEAPSCTEASSVPEYRELLVCERE